VLILQSGLGYLWCDQLFMPDQAALVFTADPVDQGQGGATGNMSGQAKPAAQSVVNPIQRKSGADFYA
jgi:hypothetical protein